MVESPVFCGRSWFLTVELLCAAPVCGDVFGISDTMYMIWLSEDPDMQDAESIECFLTGAVLVCGESGFGLLTLALDGMHYGVCQERGV